MNSTHFSRSHIREIMNHHFYLPLETYIADVIDNIDKIDQDRKSILEDLATYVTSRDQLGSDVHLVFICTHNSRRSHMGQLWAQVAAAYFKVPQIKTYSGGTEATSFNLRAVEAMRRAGFRITGAESTNPHYKISFGSGYPDTIAFSKVFDDPTNPGKGFAAIMTCSDADEACPIVPGADIRIPLHYDDPKAFDGTDQETKMYDERCWQIALEMFHLMSNVRN